MSLLDMLGLYETSFFENFMKIAIDEISLGYLNVVSIHDDTIVGTLYYTDTRKALRLFGSCLHLCSCVKGARWLEVVSSNPFVISLCTKRHNAIAVNKNEHGTVMRINLELFREKYEY